MPAHNRTDGSTMRTPIKGSITIKYNGKSYYVPNVKSCTVTKETNVFTEATYSHHVQQNGYGVPRISCTFDAVISSQLFTILATDVIGSYDVNVIVHTEYSNGDYTTFSFYDCFFDSVPMSTSLFDGSGFTTASFTFYANDYNVDTMDPFGYNTKAVIEPNYIMLNNTY